MNDGHTPNCDKRIFPGGNVSCTCGYQETGPSLGDRVSSVMNSSFLRHWIEQQLLSGRTPEQVGQTLATKLTLETTDGNS